MHAHDFIKALAIVLGVAGLTTLVFQRLRQPVVLGYLIAGLIIGPHLPIPLVADLGIVQTLSELGVILLMFSLGLEFSLRTLVKLAPTAGVTALIQTSFMLWLGYVVGRAFGWTVMESVFAGAIIAMSSTTIIAKAFDERGIRGRLRELVVGVLIVEDLIAILLMATLTALSTGAGVSAGVLALTVGRLAAFLIGLLVVGVLVVPRVIRAVVKLDRPETTVVTSLGICFGFALVAQQFGYSVALGAFLAGSLVAESGEEKTVEHLIRPVRDVFAAIFFVSVGMLIEPSLVREYAGAIAVMTALVVVGKFVGVTLGGFLTGNGTRTSVQAGMSLAQIGEFSFIIAGLGLSLNATGKFLYPIAVTVSAVTTLTTPWLIRASGPVASWIDRKLPRPLQTFVTLYGSWVERVRTSQPRAGANLGRLLRWLVLDAALLTMLIIGTSVALGSLAAWLEHTFTIDARGARVAVVLVAGVLSLPFCVGIVRLARKAGVVLAERALPMTTSGTVDFAAAPRRAFVVTLQLGCVLMVGIPMLALTQPFLPGFQGAVVLAILICVLAVGFWRSATNLQGHVQAGAQAIIEVLATQSKSAPDAEGLAEVQTILPGIGEPTALRLAPGSPAVGKTLAELNLRGLTGATVLAVKRESESVLVPSAAEVLRADDVLALAGTTESIEAARALLTG